MAVLVEQVVTNVRKIPKFQIMVENYDIWRQQSPSVTDTEAMEWLRQRFMQMTEMARSEHTLKEHVRGLKDQLKGPGEKDPKKTHCKFYLQGKCTNGPGCAYKHDPAELKKRQRAAAPAVPPPPAAPAPKKGDPKGKGKGKDKGPKGSGNRAPTPNKKLTCFAYSRGHCLAGNQCTMEHTALNEKQKEIRTKWEQDKIKKGETLTNYGPKVRGVPGWTFKPSSSDAAPAPQGKPKNKDKNKKDSRSPSRTSNGPKDKPKGKDPSTIVCRYTLNGGTCAKGDACKFKHP